MVNFGSSLLFVRQMPRTNHAAGQGGHTTFSPTRGGPGDGKKRAGRGSEPAFVRGPARHTQSRLS